MERNEGRKGGRTAMVLRAPPNLMVPAKPQDSITLPLAQNPISAPGAIIPCSSDAPSMPAYIMSVPKFHFFVSPSILPTALISPPTLQAAPASLLSPLGPFSSPSIFCLPSLIPKSILPHLSPSFSLSPGSCWFPQTLLKLCGQAAPLS